MVRERSISRYMSTAVDSAGLIVTFSKVDVPTYSNVCSMEILNILYRPLLEVFFIVTVLVVAIPGLTSI